MQRYFFDYQEGNELVRDDVGLEFASLDEVHREAMVALGEAVKDVTLEGKLPRSIFIRVRHTGEPILAVHARLESQSLG